MPKKKNKNIMIKIGLFGCQRVGKTCLNSRYSSNKFYEKHIINLPGLTEKTIERGNKTIQLKIFDTAGQERFNSLTKQYFQGLNGLFLVYDLTDKSSFDKLDQWLKQAEESINREKVPIILLGNKKDLEGRVITYEEGKNYGMSNNLPFMETSAKNNENVEEAFNALIDKCIEINSYDEVKDEEYPNQKKEGCC